MTIPLNNGNQNPFSSELLADSLDVPIELGDELFKKIFPIHSVSMLLESYETIGFWGKTHFGLGGVAQWQSTCIACRGFHVPSHLF